MRKDDLFLIVPDEDWRDLVERTHIDINQLREYKNLEQWNFQEARAVKVSDDRCGMCRDAGFLDIIAHYKAIPAAMSHDGIAKPPLCWYHKNGKIPPFIQAKMKKEEAQQMQEKENSEPHKETQTHELPLIDRIRALKAQGKKTRQISVELKISKQAVYYYLRKSKQESMPVAHKEDNQPTLKVLSNGSNILRDLRAYRDAKVLELDRVREELDALNKVIETLSRNK